MKIIFQNSHNPKTSESGQIFILALIVLVLVTMNTLLLLSGSLTFSQNTKYSSNDAEAINLAEAGIDKAVASLNVGGSYNGESETSLGNGSYSVDITSLNSSTNLITATGYIPNKSNPKIKKTIKIQISKGQGISFVYGMLTGNGGINMGNGSRINGSVYSNGNITGGNNNTITGDVYVAGGTQSSADQQSTCTSPNCSDFIFGKSVGGNNQLDIAQSFRPSATQVLNKVSLRLKKFGTPSNLTVRILGDSSNKPNKNSILTSGTLSANLVTTQYGLVDVTFSSTPTLTTNTPYWIMIDTSSDNSNYWAWSVDTLQGYTRGNPMWSPNWQASSPVWNNISGDLDFQVWMGGVPTSVNLGNGSIVGGNVHANTINNITISKDAFYQTISNSTVLGTSHPNSTDPPPAAMPISTSNITDWQDEAVAAGVTNGNLTGCPSTLGPGKFVGNFTTGNGCTITVKTPIWLTGNLTVGNSVIFKMDASQGASSGIMMVDGQTIFSNADDLRGTGQAGSYLTLLSTYDTTQTGLDAINTGNSSITGILYSPYGTITLANGATFKEIVADKINMGNGTILTYDSGLISTFFSAGPSGSFSVIKGSYQSK